MRPSGTANQQCDCFASRQRATISGTSTSRLVAPPIKLSTVGSRAFPVAAAQVWNGLPEAVVSSSGWQSADRYPLSRCHVL